MTHTHSSHRHPGFAWFVLGLIFSSVTSFAHPMGNFSVNHYAKITIGQTSIDLRYLIDMAEIPTFQETRQFDIGPTAGDARVSRISTGKSNS